MSNENTDVDSLVKLSPQQKKQRTDTDDDALSVNIDAAGMNPTMNASSSSRRAIMNTSDDQQEETNAGDNITIAENQDEDEVQANDDNQNDITTTAVTPPTQKDSLPWLQQYENDGFVLDEYHAYSMYGLSVTISDDGREAYVTNLVTSNTISY